MNTRVCKHCKAEFDISDKPKGWMANHSRWCDHNPKRKEYASNTSAVSAMRKAKSESGATNQYTKARLEGREPPSMTDETKSKIGKHSKARKHTEETKQVIREKALASNHRRLKRNIIEYKGVLLDSTWELELAIRLDRLSVEWIRPDPIPWVDEEGVTHNYFPDFYLPEYDIYLDPKNPHAINVQKKKLNILKQQYNNILILGSLEECKTYSP